VAARKDLLRLVRDLRPGQIKLLISMAKALHARVGADIAPGSDIVVPAFAENFSSRLLLHHATNEERFKKKSFEYAFRAASIAAERDARIVTNAAHPGADVLVNGVGFSLKTEASEKIRRSSITISKLIRNERRHRVADMTVHVRERASEDVVSREPLQD